MASVLITFFLARRLFDNQVAWMTAILMVGCELLWRFSVSGLSTQLLLLIFLGLIWCLVWLESEEREPVWGQRAQFWLAGATGLLLGLGALTRYAFGWLLIPVLIYLGVFCGCGGSSCCCSRWACFSWSLSPWVARNLVVSRTPFGTAGYAVLETSFLFPENKLATVADAGFQGAGPETVPVQAHGQLAGDPAKRPAQTRWQLGVGLVSRWSAAELSQSERCSRLALFPAGNAIAGPRGRPSARAHPDLRGFAHGSMARTCWC